MNKIDPATLLTIVTACVSVWAFYDRSILNKLILSPYLVVHKKQWYRVITHAFVHADWMHLIFNMVALWSFGQAVFYYFSQITAFPSIHLYIMYFVGIIIASIPDLIQKKNNPSFLSLGASGAVSAVIFSGIFFAPWHMIYVFFLPCPGILFAVLYLIYTSYMNKRGGDNINHNAHFYGSVFGFIYPILIEPSSFQYFIQQLLHPAF